MAPAAKIAAGATLAGLMLAIMVMAARQPALPHITVSYVTEDQLALLAQRVEDLRVRLARVRLSGDGEDRGVAEAPGDAAGRQSSSQHRKRPGRRR